MCTVLLCQRSARLVHIQCSPSFEMLSTTPRSSEQGCFPCYDPSDPQAASPCSFVDLSIQCRSSPDARIRSPRTSSPCEHSLPSPLKRHDPARRTVETSGNRQTDTKGHLKLHCGFKHPLIDQACREAADLAHRHDGSKIDELPPN